MPGALSVRTSPRVAGDPQAPAWAVAERGGRTVGHARCDADGDLTLLLYDGLPDGEAVETASALVGHACDHAGTTLRR